MKEDNLKIAELAKSIVDLQAERFDGSDLPSDKSTDGFNKRNVEVDETEECITDGTRKKGRLTMTVERTDVLEGLAVQGVQEIQQLKGVDEGHHREIVTLANFAGSAHNELQQLYEATKTEFETLQTRTSALETTVGKMGSYVQRLGTSVFGDVFTD